MIDQKAREIAAKASGTSGYITERETEAARLGIIEGRRQAFEEAAKVAASYVADDHHGDEIAAQIRALK